MAYWNPRPPVKKVREGVQRRNLLDAEDAYRNIGALRSTDTTLDPVAADSDAKRLQRGARLGQVERINALRTRLGVPEQFDIHSKEASWLRPRDPVETWDDLKPWSFDRKDGLLDFRRGNAANTEIGYLTAMENANRGKTADLIGQNYTNAAKRAGTFSNTAEFKAGLDDEIGYGVRGANQMVDQRLEALAKARPDYGITKDNIPAGPTAGTGVFANEPQKRLKKLQMSFLKGEMEYRKDMAKQAKQQAKAADVPTYASTSTAQNQADNTETVQKAATDAQVSAPSASDTTTASTSNSLVSGAPTTSKNRLSALQKKRGVTI